MSGAVARYHKMVDKMQIIDTSEFAAVNNSEPKPGLSERFRGLATVDVLEPLKQLGWQPIVVKERKKRDRNLQPYAKHMVLLAPDGSFNRHHLGGLKPAMWVRNANDGTGSISCFSGLYRFACSNGVVVGFERIGIKYSHTSKDLDAIFDGVQWVVAEAERGMEVAERWNAVKLVDRELAEIGRRAAELRFGEIEPEHTTPIVEQLLKVRRWEDAPDTLWNVFNRIQENSIVGGLRLPDNPNSLNKNGQPRVNVTRRLRDGSRLLDFNRDLWQIASEFAEEIA